MLRLLPYLTLVLTIAVNLAGCRPALAAGSTHVHMSGWDCIDRNEQDADWHGLSPDDRHGKCAHRQRSLTPDQTGDVTLICPELLPIAEAGRATAVKQPCEQLLRHRAIGQRRKQVRQPSTS